jgi:PIN domain nuclease of toxin-antitoxin system
MKYLLDTHAFLWWVADDEQLSVTARNIISNPDNQIYFSVVSAWEIVIKTGTGKLILPEVPAIYIPSRIASNQFQILPVSLNHILSIPHLEKYHKDPFDRLLIAQSYTEKLALISIDSLICQYSIQIIWECPINDLTPTAIALIENP